MVSASMSQSTNITTNDYQHAMTSLKVLRNHLLSDSTMFAESLIGESNLAAKVKDILIAASNYLMLRVA